MRVRQLAENAVLEVVDDGPGMTAETAAHVFERFYRADTSRTRASGGSELGLSIVSTLVRAHGGSIELDTQPGHASTFRVLPPVAGPADRTTQPAAPSASARG